MPPARFAAQVHMRSLGLWLVTLALVVAARVWKVAKVTDCVTRAPDECAWVWQWHQVVGGIGSAVCEARYASGRGSVCSVNALHQRHLD